MKIPRLSWLKKFNLAIFLYYGHKKIITIPKCSHRLLVRKKIYWARKIAHLNCVFAFYGHDPVSSPAPLHWGKCWWCIFLSVSVFVSLCLRKKSVCRAVSSVMINKSERYTKITLAFEMQNKNNSQEPNTKIHR